MTTATSTRATAPPLTRPPGPPGLRLQLDPSLVGPGAVDGGWWPRSRDPDTELPGLIAGLDTSLGPITRVALNLDAHTIGLTRASQNRVVLLVIPPEATTTAAQIAMAMAADAGNSAGPADILAAAGIGGQDPAPQAAP
jgi:Family of unknown function (DUF5994)